MLYHLESLSLKNLSIKYNGNAYTYEAMLIEELISPSVLSHIKIEYKEMLLFISNEPTVTSQYPKQLLNAIMKFLFEKQIERKCRWAPMLSDLRYAKIISDKEKEKKNVNDILNSVESSLSSSSEENINDDDDSNSSKEIKVSKHKFFTDDLMKEIEEDNSRLNNDIGNHNDNSNNSKEEASIKDILNLIKMLVKTEEIAEQSKMNSPIKEIENKRNSKCLNDELNVRRVITKKKVKKLSTRRFFPNIYDPKKEYEVNSIIETDKSISRNIEELRPIIPFRSLAKFYITSQYKDKVLNERKKILGDSLSYYLSQKEQKPPLKSSKNIPSKLILKRPTSNIRITHTKVFSPPPKESFLSSLYITPINVSDIKSLHSKEKVKSNKLPIFTSEAIRNAIYNSPNLSYCKIQKKSSFHCKTQSFSKSSRRVIKLKKP